MNDNLERVAFAAGDLTFTQWRALVDKEFARLTGLEADDFADWGYADAYDDGVDPVEAAHMALATTGLGRAFLLQAGVDPDLVCEGELR